MHLSTRPAARFARDTFADYATAAPAIRSALGIDRLSPKLAASVREAVAKHTARAESRDAPPIPTPIDRIRRRLRRETATAMAPLIDHYRTKGASKLAVIFGDTPRAWMNAPTQWVSGRSGFGHVVTDTTANITVMPSWRRRVLATGLAFLDGLLTTHAAEIAVDGEITVYRAAWVRQRAGYNIAAESGLIALHRPSGTAYHATDSDPKKAISGLRRKLTAQAVPTAEKLAKRDARAAKRQERRAAGLAKLAGQLSRLDVSDPTIGAVVVTRSDSLRAGNCVPGTDEFIDRYAPGRDSATIAEIAYGLRSRGVEAISDFDLTLARQLAAACLIAIRRDKNARRMVGV